MAKFINLYIDESGVAAIYKKDYKFFVMTSVIATDEQEKIARAALAKWRKKYLIDDSSSFHAVDFFEDNPNRKTGLVRSYRKKFLDNIARFDKATQELIQIILKTKFSSQVGYIDIVNLRKKLKLDSLMEPTNNQIKTFINKEYSGEILYPIVTISEFLFKYHERCLIRDKHLNQGFVCYESQSEYDTKIIQTFHTYANRSGNGKRTYMYGRNVLGISFYTKRSLCSFLEVADLIAYVTTQILRTRYSKRELTINEERLEILLKHYGRIQKKLRLRKIDLTKKCIQDMKIIQSKQKRTDQ